ncbi:MAG: cytochrome c [Puia sp.]
MNNIQSLKRVISGTLITICLLIVGPYIQVQAQSKPWPVPADAKKSKNPVAADVNALKEGKALYGSTCTPCHGEKGKGDGPAAVALDPKPADHTSAKMLTETDGSLFYKISEGRKPMPQYKAVLTERQRWELVDYIRSLNKGIKK